MQGPILQAVRVVLRTSIPTPPTFAATNFQKPKQNAGTLFQRKLQQRSVFMADDMEKNRQGGQQGQQGGQSSQQGGQSGQRGQGPLQVRHHVRRLPLGQRRRVGGRVGQLVGAAVAGEQVDREAGEPGRGDAAHHVLDVLLKAAVLVHDQDPAGWRACGACRVADQLCPVGALHRDGLHLDPRVARLHGDAVGGRLRRRRGERRGRAAGAGLWRRRRPRGLPSAAHRLEDGQRHGKAARDQRHPSKQLTTADDAVVEVLHVLLEHVSLEVGHGYPPRIRSRA